MKVDIEKYIQGCLQNQMKKVIRVKTKNPKVITDTPTTAFEKISMDIVGSLSETYICEKISLHIWIAERSTYLPRQRF